MKVAIIGLGSVGAAVATAIKNTGLVHEMVLFDRDGVRSQAAAMDLGHASAFSFDVKIIAANSYREIKGSEIVIISAGANQKPGQTRTDLLAANANVIRDIIPRVMANTDPKRVKIIIVTNPLDVMVMLARDLSGLPASRVIGTGTMLDSARLRTILARHLSVSPMSINAYVLGEHGDSSVVNWESINIGAIPLNDFCRATKISLPQTTRRTIEHRVQTAAYEIIKGRGATWDGIAAAVNDLLRCIINDEKRILTVSTCAPKTNLAMSLPTIVDMDGAIQVLTPRLSSMETVALRESGRIIKKNYNNI